MNYIYKILKNQDGERFVSTAKGIIPADIAALAAGPDAWLSRIECRCLDCKQLFPLRDLQGNGRWCQECQDASILEDQEELLATA